MASAREVSAVRHGIGFRSALSSRSSVSPGVASTKIGSTCGARCGSRPAFTNDDLPQPEGPYMTPTGNVASASILSIRVFQNRIVSGSPSRSRGPGSSSRKKSLSSSSKERRPLGTIRRGGCEPESGAGIDGRGVLSTSARTVAPLPAAASEAGSTVASGARSVTASGSQSGHAAKNAWRSSSRSATLA